MKFLLEYVFLLSFLVAIEAKTYFKENFSDDDWAKRWIESAHEGKEFGKFERSYGKFYGDQDISYGLKTTQDAKFYSLSAKFNPFSNEGKTLVIQFSVKHEQNIDCGGGYVKIFDDSLDQKDMHGESPYLIMFGPDICGPGTKKVHAILNYKGTNHLISKDVRCKDDVFTHVYTFIIKPDNTYNILIDNESVQKGNLEDDWNLLAPKKIKDPDAKKPEDWDDRKTIEDENDTKPEDWDQPEHIPDPDATKPEDWDDEMDGEWEPPMIDNPDFKGEWKPKQVDNPNYSGKWVHPEIDNPEYVADSNLYKFEKISVVGFDLWQVKSGSIFDNIIITDSIEEAKDFAEETWEKIKEQEKKMKEEQDEEESKKAQENMPDDAEDNEDLDDEEDEEPKGEDLPHEEL